MFEIAAGDLRQGHLVRVGASTNYALVADVSVPASRIEVTLYNGNQPCKQPTMFFEPEDIVHLSLCPDSLDGTWPTSTDH